MNSSLVNNKYNVGHIDIQDKENKVNKHTCI